MMNLRPAQAEILKYRHGRMAISAVPGSGKTFTLSLLAAELLASGRVNADLGQQVLVVTYLNSSVDTFRARIRRRLLELERPLHGFDVRTLHSLALEIVLTASSGASQGGDAPAVADEAQSNHFLARAVDGWIEANAELWHAFLPGDSPQTRARWRDVTERTARAFIRTAKNQRYRPAHILARLQGNLPEAASLREVEATPLLHMLAGVYDRYQAILSRQGALDFDDLIWQATDLLEQRPDLADTLRQRWPYVLEDEAQDSVLLQEMLLSALTGLDGNWVRVGDPNQAITSTFTAAHPRYFNAFIDRPDVLSRPLPNSGRCAPLIFNAANTVVQWVCDSHPVPEVRQHAFRRQEMLPTPPGDAQPNPPDSEANIYIRVYRHREEEELPAVAQLAFDYAQQQPEHTLAILAPTNDVGHALAEHLDALDADYDNLLRGSSREREVAAALHALLSLLADPLDTRALVAAHAALYELNHPVAAAELLQPPEIEQLHTLLRSVHSPERLLFPGEAAEPAQALPAGVASPEDVQRATRLAAFLRGLFDLRALPVDDLVLALGDELFARPAGNGHGAQDGLHEADLAIAYQIANVMRQWRDLQPEWRLPELVAELAGVAEGRRHLPMAGPADLGYEPQPGRITLATQHSAKGLEWDAVFLVGIDGFWIPGSLDAPFLGVHDFLGGDPAAEAAAQLRYLMEGDSGLYEGRTATESAHIEIMNERLRLLYVGITRARRALHLSRSRATRRYNKERDAEPATVLGVLYDYLRRTQQSASDDGR
ncbi:MAG: ATP-dependent helicase [Chloroflexi bacterium]|nr:ATP-dependent helicase [Chloroflexota bacterium]